MKNNTKKTKLLKKDVKKGLIFSPSMDINPDFYVNTGIYRTTKSTLNSLRMLRDVLGELNKQAPRYVDALMSVVETSADMARLSMLEIVYETYPNLEGWELGFNESKTKIKVGGRDSKKEGSVCDLEGVKRVRGMLEKRIEGKKGKNKADVIENARISEVAMMIWKSNATKYTFEESLELAEKFITTEKYMEKYDTAVKKNPNIKPSEVLTPSEMKDTVDIHAVVTDIMKEIDSQDIKSIAKKDGILCDDSEMGIA